MGEKAMSFLNNKSFHPGNIANRFKLFEAEEKKKTEDKRKEELKREYEQEALRRETKSYLTGGDAAVSGGVGFMYQKPAGYIEPGLRKRKDPDKELTPAERDVERYGSLLADAPRNGSYTTTLDVNHKPFGVELRKVRCKRCEAWGHSAGDRECPLRNAPYAADDAKKELIDPVAISLNGGQGSGDPLRWELKGVPDTGVRGIGTKNDANQQFVLADDELLVDSSVSSACMADIDPEVLAALSSKQQKKLLKMYQRQLRSLDESGEGDDVKQKRKEEKKEKKRKRRKEERREKGKHKDKHKKKSRSGSDDDDSGSESRGDER